MAKMHEIHDRVKEITGLAVFNANGSVEVIVTGDQSEMVPVVAAKLTDAGVRFTQSRHRKFKGAVFSIPLRNAGTALQANWEFA